jgi:hypothetical protein
VNLSDLPAKVALNYQSKVVTFRQRQVTIPPRQSADLKLDFVPRKINPDYRKEITFVNTKNKSNDQFVSVRANNIDPLRITFHSVFYHLITPYSHNYLDFENVIVGSPAVTFSPLFSRSSRASTYTWIINLSISTGSHFPHPQRQRQGS